MFKEHLTRLLRRLGDLLIALRIVGRWVRERSVLLARVWVLTRGIIRDLNLKKTKIHIFVKGS